MRPVRADLTALGADELELLSNRGTVRRAAREAPSVTVAEDSGGTVVATGADGVVTTLPPGVPIEDARCTCDAAGLCRHVVRAVLAYGTDLDGSDQGEQTPGSRSTGADRSPGERVSGTPSPGPEPDPPAASPPRARAAREAARSRADRSPDERISGTRPPGWDPDLLAALPPRVRRAGEKLVAAGVTATVVRSAKPVVLLHESGTTVRFLVPGDVAYARCDCREAPPCRHVVPAVRALREPGAVVELHRRTPDTGALSELDTALALLAEAGAASGQAAVAAALERAATGCRAGGLTWPADVASELADQCARHADADSGFDAVRLARLTGEAVLRADTVRHDGSPVPPLFAGGPPETRTVAAGGRLIGLGTRVRRTGRVVETDALAYDAGAGRVVALGRTTVDPDDDSPRRPFAALAAASLQKGITIAAAGAGQLVATGGTRTAADRLELGRRAAALGAQRYDWADTLRAPVLLDGAAEAAELAGAAFPRSLGPRTAGAGVVALPVTGIHDAGFDVVAQAVTAVLGTPDGGTVTLAHPYTGRSAGGCEALLDALVSGAVRFVAGELDQRGSTTVVAPCGVVADAGGVRRLVAPWTDPAPATGTSGARVPAAGPERREPTAADRLDGLQAEAGTLLTTGVARADRTVRDAWDRLAGHTAALGGTVLAARVRTVATALAARASDPRWDPSAAAGALLGLAAALELARTR